jgi:hypothetical protein
VGALIGTDGGLGTGRGPACVGDELGVRGPTLAGGVGPATADGERGGTCVGGDDADGTGLPGCDGLGLGVGAATPDMRARACAFIPAP